MKRLIPLLLCILLLTACSPKPSTPVPPIPTDTTAVPIPIESSSSTAPTETTAPTESTAEEKEPFVFTRENFPRMDGSTALIPLGEAIASVLLGEPRETAAELISFNRTTQSYRNLMNGYCDILIAAEPNAAVFEEMKQENFQIEMTPIAMDALIFVVNASNPVDNLTTEQIRKIYTGEITNWKEVGGNDEAILPFQRNEDAGSQSLMRKLVMGDLEFVEGPMDYVVDTMGLLMESVKNYDNSANAIGYSVYYYANDMRMAEGLKIISVDGVDPTPETIGKGEYPHLNPYYTVIPKDAAADAPNRILYDWLQTPEGQYLLSLEGYVPVSATEN